MDTNKNTATIQLSTTQYIVVGVCGECGGNVRTMVTTSSGYLGTCDKCGRSPKFLPSSDLPILPMR